MTKTNSKKALLSSAFALVLSVAMLIGTTFAWFTDTASTGINKIQAGNLDVKLMYIGAKNNVFNSLVEFFAKMKKGTIYGLTPLVNNTVCGDDFFEAAKATGHYVELDPTMSMEEAKKYAKDMDILYTDTWVDMEFFNNPAYKQQKEETLAKMMPYQLNEEFTEGSKAIVFHDMPMHQGFEISQGVIDKNLNHILDEAENRRHAEKAVMYTLLNS